MKVVTANQISSVFMIMLMIGSIFGSLVGFMMFGTENAAAEHTADGETIGLWHFDEGSGQVAVDSSGNDNNGTLGSTSGSDSNDPIWTDGKFNKALDFDGVNDGVIVSNSGELSGMSQLTLEAWVNPRNAVGIYIIYKWAGGGAYNLGTNNTSHVYFSVETGSGMKVLWFNDPLPLNKWTYLAGTYNGSMMKIYKNGKFIDEVAWSGTIKTSTGNLGIGVDGGDWDSNFNGTIDEVRISNIARSSNDISSYYTNSGPTGYWKFDEGSGQVAADSSDNGNDGTLGSTSGSDSNDPTWVDGKIGKALEFDGVDDYIGIPHSEGLNFTTNNLTIEAWIKPKNLSQSQHMGIVTKIGAIGVFALILHSGDYINAYLYGPNYYVVGNTLLQENKWYYIVLTFNGSEGKIYVNGNLDGKTVGKGTIYQDTGNLLIGYRTGSNYYFNGTIDEVRISNYAKTTKDISDYYDKSVTAGYWKFDEGSGQVAGDSSGNGNDGRLGSTSGVDSSDPTWVDGKIGKALKFDGVDDFLTVDPSKSLNITNEFSIETWVKLSELDKQNSIISKGSYSLKIGSDQKMIFSGRGKSSGNNWTLVEDSDEESIYSYAVFNDHLYASTGHNGSIYRSSDGKTWNLVNDTTELNIWGSVVFNDYLYVGTSNGGKIFRTNDGTNWTEVFDSPEQNILSMAVLQGDLYAGTATAGRIYSTSNGTSWAVVEDTTENNIDLITSFKGYLYAGTRPGGKILRSNDGATWNQVLDTAEIQIASFAVFNDYLYAGTESNGLIYRSYSGTVWEQVHDSTETHITALAVYNGYLYAGTGPSGKIYQTGDGKNWTEVKDTNATYVLSFAVFQGKLYTGPSNLGEIFEMGSGFDLFSNYKISKDDWTHITCTYNGSTAKIFINGMLDQTLNYKMTVDHNNLSLLIGNSYGSTIGSRYISGEENFNGIIDEVRILNCALTSSEIYDNYISIVGSGPDLKIIPTDITFSNDNPSPSEEITISTKVQNTGTGSGSATVKFWDRDPDNVIWQKYLGNPVLVNGSDGDWDDTHTRFPKVIYDGTIYKMWYSGWDDINGYSRIGYATSNDGKSWNKYSQNPVIQNGSSGLWDSRWVRPGTIFYDGDSYKMWYVGGDGANLKVGYATSNNGINWTKHSGNPVMSIGTDYWNNTHVVDPVIIFDGSNYQMWYSGRGTSGTKSAIGYATSNDGINWTKYSGNPIILPGASGQWDDKYVNVNSVYFENGLYKMWYTGYDASSISPSYYLKLGYATSIDGMNWIKYDNNPIMDVGFTNDWDEYQAGLSSIMKIGSIYKMWYTGKDKNTIEKIGYTEGTINATLIAEKTITDLGAGQNTTVSTTWQVPSVARNYTVFLTVEDITPEDSDLSNNKAESQNLTVSGTSPNEPELYISSSLIYVNETNINDGDTVRIYAKIWNNGLVDATSANITFWDGDPDNGGVFIGNVISQFASGYMTVRFVDWKASAGTHTIYVLIKDTVPTETKLTNNKACITVTVNQLPKLVKPLPDVQFDEDTTLYNAFDLDDHFSDTSYVGLGVGKDHTQLTTENYAQRYPSFSPDGKTIIYDSLEDGGGYFDIWSMDTDGMNRVKLTSDNYHQEQPAYSPDGMYIVYSSYEDGDGYADILLMAANGSNHVRLTNDSYNQSAPKFSPDGSKIVYYSKEDGGIYNDIWQLTRNGANWDATCTHTQLTTDATTQYNPMFSPDGSRIAFEDDSGSPGTWNIWTMNDTGGDRKQLTTNGGRGPLYSPDGEVIIYFSQENVSAYWDVWLMTTDGYDHTQLTIEQADQLYGCFSPDGSMIAYNSNEDSGADIDIWVMKFAKDTLTFTYSGNTHVQVNINANRTVDFSADADWYGSENITLRATDPYSYYDEDTFTVTVNPINDAPVVTDIPDILLNEDQYDSDLDLDNFVSDIDNTKDQLTWKASGNSNIFITIDPVTHKVNFSAVQDWNGQELITLTATDPGLLSDNDTLMVKVTSINDPPKISNIPDVQFDEDGSNSSLDLDNYVTDADNTKSELKWTALTNGNIKTSIDGTTHVITLTAKENWYGTQNLTLKVEDPKLLWDIFTIKVTVNAVNDAPKVIGPVPDFSMKEDTIDNSTINLKDVFVDVDDDKLTYSVSGDSNINVTINTKGKVKLQPKKDWYGEEILTFKATDGKSTAVTDTVKVNVTPVNDPSSINGNAIQFSLGQQNIYEDIQMTLDLSIYISDVDSDDSTLIISENSQYVSVSGQSLIFNYPEGITKDEVTIKVSDGENEVSTTIMLNVIPVNDPPVLVHIPDITVSEGETIVLSPGASDVDNTDAELTISIMGAMNSSLWVTGYTDAGTYEVNVTVSDGDLVDWQIVTITIKNIPQPPVIEPIGAQEVNENDQFTMQVDSWDWDEDNLTYSLTQSPAGMSIDTSTGLITWQPSWQQVGDHLITVEVSDGMFETTSSFKLTVINVNDPPVANVIYYTGVSAYNGESVNFTLRIAGTKYMAVTLSLFEDEVLIGRETITRSPGNPDEQTKSLFATLDLEKEYTLGMEYVAEKLGATPVKLYINYGDNSVVLHYTFNAMHAEKKEVIYDINAIIENNPINDKTVRFDASSSYDPDGDITKYLWDFGDGDTSTSKMATHVYKKIDWYTVTLTLTDNENETTIVEYRVNPSYSTVVLPVQGGTDVVDYDMTGEAQITAVYVSNPSKVTEGTIGLFIDYTLQGEGELNWVNITFDYSDIVLPEGIDEDDLKLYWYDEVKEVWVLCENTGVDTENKLVWANVTHFTVFAPMADAQQKGTGPVEPELMILPVIIGIVVFFILGIIMTGAVVRSENALVPLANVAAKFVTETYKTDNELRGRILGMIEARPGVHYSWIKINIGKGNGVCAYHLHKLEKDEVIRSKRDGSFKRYYPKETSKNGESTPVLSDIQQQMIEIIKEHPGASQKEIGYLLDEKKSKINYHIKLMERKRIIRVKRDEIGHTECYLAQETAYIPSPTRKKPKGPSEEKPIKEIHVERKKKEPQKKEFVELRSTKRIVRKYEKTIEKKEKKKKEKDNKDIDWED